MFIMSLHHHSDLHALMRAQIAAQINVFILGGYETTAALLAFAVYHLANTPAAEARLIQEVDAFGRNAVPTYDELNTKVNFREVSWLLRWLMSELCEQTVPARP